MRCSGCGLLPLALVLAGCGGGPSEPGGGGRLFVEIVGLPAGAPARVRVVSPNGNATDVASSQTLRGLKPGRYSLDARYVSAQGQVWDPNPPTLDLTLSEGDSATATVNYVAAPAPAVDLSIAATELVQVTQRPDGSIPMVEARDALLRVYVVASGANAAQPDVFVRLYRGGGRVDTVRVPAPGSSVPTSIGTGSLTSSWNAHVLAGVMTPGLRYDVLLDPEDRVPETDKANNAWPGTGTQQPVTLHAVPPFQLRYVPVFQVATGQAGAIDDGNKAWFTDRVRRMYPISGATIDVHARYLSSAPAAVPNDSNGAWSQILLEMNALRSAEGASPNYMGIIKVSYSSGIAGLGFIGAPAAVSWDRSTSAPDVVAHELGHNLGRMHAPCGNPPGVDLSYPHAGGGIGTWGLDLAGMTLMDPGVYADIMGYCNPKWISDYTYLAVLSYRVSHPVRAPSAVGEGLLVWGRIREGQLQLEPAIAVRAPALLPPRPGPNRIEGVDGSGGRLFSLAFEGEAVADLPDDGERQFAFVVPLARSERQRLSYLALSARGLTALRGVAASIREGGGTGAAIVSRRVGEDTEVRWDPSYPLAVARDRASGQIVALARGGRGLIPGTIAGVSIQLSDGVRGGIIPPAP